MCTANTNEQSSADSYHSLGEVRQNWEEMQGRWSGLLLLCAATHFDPWQDMHEPNDRQHADLILARL